MMRENLFARVLFVEKLFANKIFLELEKKGSDRKLLKVFALTIWFEFTPCPVSEQCSL